MANSLWLPERRRCSSSISSWQGQLAGSMSTILVILLCLVQPSWQQQDPVNDFCRRWGHQTTIIDRQLFIDGGIVNWNPLSQNPSNYSNSWLLYNDLNTSPSGPGMPQLHANLSKKASIPNVSGGVLWADEVNKRFYLFGGDNFGASPQTSPSLYSYDVLHNEWDSFGSLNNGVTSVSYGMGVGVSDLGQGYMLGGWQSNASVPGWSGSPFATSGMIIYDYQMGTWSNNTGPDLFGRAEGVMVYLPASRTGILVYFGGILVINGSVVPSPMNQIHIYDIQSSQWYTQNATGDIPGDRRRFCAGATWVADRSSYNIYLYGGAGFGANASGYDDVYILSLPSFTWIKWWENPGSAARPHNMLSCNVVDGTQMIIVGGSFPKDRSTCDSPNAWGTHNLELNEPAPGSIVWNTYQPNSTTYAVPSAIINIIGGSPTGGATMKSPSAGFQNNDLSVYFQQRASAGSRTPTRPISTATGSSTPKPSGIRLGPGVIAGIVAGVVVGLVGLLAACFCIIRIRKNGAHISEVSAPIVPLYGAGSISKAFPQRPGRSYDPRSPHIAQQRRTSAYQVLPSHAHDAVELSGTNSSLGNYITVDADGHPVYSPKDEGVPPYTSNWHQPNSLPQEQHFSPTSPQPQHKQLPPVLTELDGESTIIAASPTPTYSAVVGRMPLKKITPIYETYYSP